MTKYRLDNCRNKDMEIQLRNPSLISDKTIKEVEKIARLFRKEYHRQDKQNNVDKEFDKIM